MSNTVSVVVPAYNAGPFIRQCVKSILQQSHPPAEILVVDDGSTDQTAGIVSKFADPVHLLRQDNRGVSSARNRGLWEATGSLVAFCDADDVWLPRKLQMQAEALAAHPDASAAFSGATKVDADLQPVGVIPCPALDEVTFGDLLRHERGRVPPQIPSTLLARKELLDRAGEWDPQLSDAADWDMALRLRRLGPFVGPRDSLIWYRVHPGGMSSKARLRASDAKRLFQKLVTSAVPEDLAEIRAAWGRNAVVMAASLAKTEGFPVAAAWLLGEFRRNPWPVGKACISRMIYG
jgi:glycosyltransferase involved in cell wall biosynthesis